MEGEFTHWLDHLKVVNSAASQHLSVAGLYPLWLCTASYVDAGLLDPARDIKC